MAYGSVKVDSIVTSTKTVTVDTVVTTGDTGTVTSTMLLDGTILNVDINANAEIAVSKLADGAARQLLQTDAAGTGVEWTDNVDVPGTLGVTGAATFSSGASDSAGSFRRLPQNSQTAGYTLVASDTGKHISTTTGGVTIPAGVMSIGDVVTIFNNSGSSQTITQGTSVTLRKADSTDTGNRTLARYGLATVLCVASNTFVISGVGLT